MKASTPRIVAPGDLANERVAFTVSDSGDLSTLLLIDSNYIDTASIEAGTQLAYWLGGDRVEAGDHVIVYTRTGTESVRKRDDGLQNHFFYRGLSQPLYGDSQACVVLASIVDWSTSKPRKGIV